MRMRLGTAISCVLMFVAMMAFPKSAHAVGELDPMGCINDNDLADETCALSVNALRSAFAVTVSPDGKSVYAVSRLNDNAIVRFNRSTTGALTPAGCVDDNDTGEDVCAQSVNGLGGAASVAVSPDGKSVYVVSRDDDAIVRFNRGAAGDLTPAGCVDDNDTGEDVCAQSVNGLGGAGTVVVSPDGSSVYVASRNDHSVVRFNRSATGALTTGGCVNDNDSLTDACAQSVNGLGRPFGMAVSLEGASLYVAAESDDALVRFNRSATGALTPGGCVDDNDSGSDVCAQSVNGLQGADGVAVSPDGKSVYVTSAYDWAVVRFNRSSTGALTPAGCVDDNGFVGDTCALSVTGLSGPSTVTVSPDGRSVYVSALNDFAVVTFGRSSAGTLTYGGCIEDNDTGPGDCAESTDGLEVTTSVTVSPDGESVYASSLGDHAVARFNRAS